MAQLAHMVFFTLNDSSEEAKANMVAACNKYLKDHDGVEFFSVGTLCEELDRPVNVRDFHVALHIVFDNKDSHDKYQVHERHLQFIEENKAQWANVRIFDSLC